MRKLIIIFVCALAILSACEKVVLNNPVTDPTGTLPTDTTSKLPDKTPPIVGSTVPLNNATGIAINSPIVATFSEAMDPTTITSLTFTLQQGTTVVPGAVSYTGTKATFTPTSNLTANSIYTGTITTGTKDLAGNAMISNNAFSFTTGTGTEFILPSVSLTNPLDNATGVAFNKPIDVTFSMAMDPTTINTSTFTLKQGTNAVPGAVTYAGTKATFTPTVNLDPSKIYTGTITTGAKNPAGIALISNYTFSFTTGAAPDITAPTVISADPLNNATGVEFNKAVAVTFSEAMDPTSISNSTFTLKQGTTAISGTVSYSGFKATFTPASTLTASTIYTGTITTGVKDLAGNTMVSNFTFNFTTGALPVFALPYVNFTDPVDNATGVAFNKAVAVTFSEAMDATSINTSTFTLQQGSTAVAGAVTYAGTKATFTPASALAASTNYTGTIISSVKDLAGNAMISNYTFSFTTGAAPDIIAPTVISTDPLNNATAVATSKVVAINFSEAMNSTTITSSTFTLNQGTTAIAGTVAYSGTMATFTPSAVLIAGTVYTATITTGGKDLAGNALTSNTVWSFTTAGTAPASGLSFATDVMPVLAMCENCHNHGWTPSTVASTYYANLVSKGYVKAASYTSSKIYTNTTNNHPVTQGGMSTANLNKVITWMQQGSKNN